MSGRKLLDPTTYVPSEQETGWASERLWNIWRELRTPYHPVCSLVTTPTAIGRQWKLYTEMNEFYSYPS